MNSKVLAFNSRSNLRLWGKSDRMYVIMPPPCAFRSFRCNTKFVMWNWAVGNDPSSLVSLSVNISHNPLCSMERIGSYLFRKLFILIWPIITFLGLQYRKFLRSDMKSLGWLTKDSSAISDNWVISISTVIFLGTKCGDCFIDNSLDTRQVSVIDSSPVPVLSYPLTLVALSGDIALSGAIELSPEVLGGSGNTAP